MILVRTIGRYFGLRFVSAVLAVFAGIMILTAMIDFLEQMRRTSDLQNVSAAMVAKIALFRVPFITERVMPFAVLVGAMFCYLNLSRRLELVVARAAGISAWQFVAPALVLAWLMGLLSTTVYNPFSAVMREYSSRLETDLYSPQSGLPMPGSGFWLRQRNEGGQAVINAKSSRQQGIQLGGVSVFRFDDIGQFQDRIEAKSATLESGYWRLEDTRTYVSGRLPSEREFVRLQTTLTPAQVGESFATPETVPFWSLPGYINAAENAGLSASGYRLQYYQLLAQPFYLASMVFLAAAVSLRFFRMGGVQKVVLTGLAAGFFLYVLAKITGDLSKAGILAPFAAAALPTMIGGITGVMSLLYQEDG
jgi:lipopolysaccharide export system permease protein